MDEREREFELEPIETDARQKKETLSFLPSFLQFTVVSQSSSAQRMEIERSSSSLISSYSLAHSLNHSLYHTTTSPYHTARIRIVGASYDTRYVGE